MKLQHQPIPFLKKLWCIGWCCSQNISLLGIRLLYSVQQVADCVIYDSWCTGKSVRPLKSKNSKLNKGEYMIAARVAKYPLLYKKKNVKNKTYYSYDFHFMKKDPKTGKWWTKSGTYKIICKGKIDPDKKSNWAMPGDKNYKTVYSWLSGK